MPAFNTIKEISDISAVLRKSGAEPIIADGKLTAIEIGDLRIAPEKGGWVQVWKKDES